MSGRLFNLLTNQMWYKGINKKKNSYPLLQSPIIFTISRAGKPFLGCFTTISFLTIIQTVSYKVFEHMLSELWSKSELLSQNTCAKRAHLSFWCVGLAVLWNTTRCMRFCGCEYFGLTNNSYTREMTNHLWNAILVPVWNVASN